MKRKLQFLTAWIAVIALMLGAPALAGELSDDLYSFEAAIDGVHYAFPFAFDELTQNGWTLKDDGTEKLKPNQYAMVYFEKEGLTQMMCYVFNCYSSAREISRCPIAGFELSTNSYDKLPTASCEMPRGIALNRSTLSDVIAAYGEPSSRYDGDTRVKLTYTHDSWRSIEFTAGGEEVGTITGIRLQNLTEPAGFVDEVGDTETPPAAVGLYTAPTKLGDNPLAHTIEIDGALFQIPAPVSEFLNNGFTLVPDKSDEVADGAGSAWVTLARNNQQLRTHVTNYAEDATNVVNCFVTDVSIGRNDANLPGSVALGIKIGMPRAELMDILAGMEYLTDEGSSYTTYAIADNERATNAVTVYVSKETDDVYKLSVENSVRRADIEKYLAGAPAEVEAPKPVAREFEPASPLATADQLSGEYSAFEALINGRLYAFPIDYETLTADGWVIEGDPDAVVTANTYEMITFKLGSPMAPKTRMTALVVNLTDADVKVSEAKIGGFTVSASDDKREPRTDFVLAKGITLGTSTIDEVLAAYGEPSYRNEQRSLEFEVDRYEKLRLTFEENVLTGIDLRNFK